MRIFKAIIIIGGLLFILPFLGVPYLWKQIIGGLAGVVLMWIGLRLWREALNISHA